MSIQDRVPTLPKVGRELQQGIATLHERRRKATIHPLHRSQRLGQTRRRSQTRRVHEKAQPGPDQRHQNGFTHALPRVAQQSQKGREERAQALGRVLQGSVQLSPQPIRKRTHASALSLLQEAEACHFDS